MTANTKKNVIRDLNKRLEGKSQLADTFLPSRIFTRPSTTTESVIFSHGSTYTQLSRRLWSPRRVTFKITLLPRHTRVRATSLRLKTHMLPSPDTSYTVWPVARFLIIVSRVKGQAIEFDIGQATGKCQSACSKAFSFMFYTIL